MLALVLEALFVFRPMSRRITSETARLEAAAARHQAEAARHAFGTQLRDAVEFAESESDLIDTIETAHHVSRVPGQFEFLRTDPDEPTTMVRPDDDSRTAPHHCSVLTADGCPALRRGRPLNFSDPDALGACRHFRADALASGDATLVETARIMSSVLRPDDLLGRHGGEEFVIIIPLAPERPDGGDLAAGISVAERLRAALHAARATNRLPLCTVSIGVGASEHGLEAAIQQADQALHRAKELGRNRVEVEGDLLGGLDAVLSSGELAVDELPALDA